MNRALIFAGGMGTRMKNSTVPKQFLEIDNKPILVYTIEKFQNCKEIDSIVVVMLADYIDYTKNLLKKFNLDKVVSVVAGGKTGRESIFNGLKENVRLFGLNDDDIILIHDGVRPLIDEETILKNIECVKKHGNAITITNSVETVATIENDNVKEMIDRNKCKRLRAPQSFYLKDIYECHTISEEQHLEFIDSASMMDHFGKKLFVIEGPVENIKITTLLDYFIFKAHLDYLKKH